MNILQRTLMTMKIWSANKIFQIYFGGFYYPFESANEKLAKMSKDEYIIYISDIYRWTESKAYKNESRNLIRHVYSELATKPLDVLQITAYRLCLLFIHEDQKRMKELANKYKELIK